ncbi:MAG TPA: DUF6159 family protein [Planctomycetaceae bacterium]|nr:DUF6159 family protein [Planctomycetaceae bacterium]
MFDKIANGWELAKASGRVLRLDKELLVFPFLSGIACLLVLGSFGLPLFLSGAVTIDRHADQVTQNPLAYVLLFAFYFCNYFVIVFFNSALIACAIIRFNGGEPSLGDGLQAASARLPQILGWSLVSATVGFLLKMVESRSEKVGAFVADLLGLAWSIVTFFVIPVIVVEKVGPIDAIRRSGSILRRTWGEAFVGNQGIGLFVFLFALVSCLPALLGYLSHVPALMIAGGAITAVALIIVAAISAALHSILLAAIYVFAADGRVPDAFDRSTLQAAFTPRR